MRNKLYVGLLAVASAAYLLRRQGKRWGATEDEVHRSLLRAMTSYLIPC